MQTIATHPCSCLCKNMTGVGVTRYREEIVAGQIVYLGEHGIEALN